MYYGRDTRHHKYLMNIYDGKEKKQMFLQTFSKVLEIKEKQNIKFYTLETILY